uniref:Pentraxin family member n=1 Tax=Oryzias latipes TaxID=8090 RepID=A0A3P9IFA8_ORYLA
WFCQYFYLTNLIKLRCLSWCLCQTPPPLLSAWFPDSAQLRPLNSSSPPSNKSNKWSNQNQEIQPNVRNAGVRYGGRNYKPNMWYSNCSTWDSATGLVQIWFDGKPSFRKYIISGAITQTAILLLGQEQDSHGGGFNINQSFVGMMSDVHMWNYTLSPCEIQNYMNKGSFTPGNVLNWKALNFQINGRVETCIRFFYFCFDYFVQECPQFFIL